MISMTNTTASVVSEATARPWRNNTADETAIVGRNMEDVASTFFGDEDYDKNYATRAADAALIVKAVNSHEALVKALEEARVQIEYLDDKFTRTGTSAAVLTQIRAALAGAK